ncbi:Protein ltv1 [Friedmanniomyces endolithicus]|uniref:Protein ltv1 n=1 Tax=Friedmanniomyces endolithicus TaxID=329885 RepID=A0AAN6JFU6_9PEZI|nr:Protein ltv1 [Friedmanniomyces endolithicus]KAK0289662.1 Protein ltv1 [Friedmanniomyces endolithicus]KAK0328562.1 Protein ltv1 [Friedmanniomyces endolithicus]
MPRRKYIDKKNATTFSLVHRAQNDPLIHDENAPSMVFAEKQTSSARPQEDDYPFSDTGSAISGTSSYRSNKVRQRGDLEEEFGGGFKPNEGQAAQHGVFYDDTEYDYMQHMRDLGGVEGRVTWVDSSATPAKGKGKQKLEDALRGMGLDGRSSVAGESIDQQDVPDEIAGFQPDMDPRLRQVLEALDDEEYVDDEEDVFGELTRDGYEVERDEWERLGEQQVFDDDEGWESDHTVRAASPHSTGEPVALQLDDREAAVPPADTQAQPPADPTSGAWLDEFKKFKQSTKPSDKPIPAHPTPSALDASVLSSLASGRHKKRKGAKTSTTNYSMTSSALFRTDQQTLLDSRFDKILEREDMMDELADDEGSQLPDTASLASGMTGLSKSSRISRYSNTSGLSGVSGISSYSRMTDSEAPQLERADFSGIMDEFLGGHSKAGKGGKYIKRFGPQTGMEQLDEVRKGLGPARVKSASRQTAS